MFIFGIDNKVFFSVCAEEVDKMSLVDWLLKFTGAQTVIIFTFEIFWCFNLRIQLILLVAMIEWPKTSWNGWLNKERLRISDRHCLNNYFFFPLLIKLLRLKIRRENDFFTFFKWNCFFFVEDNHRFWDRRPQNITVIWH